MHKNVMALGLMALAIAGCSDAPTAVDLESQAGVSGASSARLDVTGRFIVTLREQTNPAGVAREHGIRPDYVYTHALTGFAGRISDAARQGLLRDSRVVRVEPDGIARTVATQNDATWGLDRLDQRSRPLSTTYSYSSSGTGVHAYIIDTGILFGH